ncbi:MAG: FMN-binding protein [Gammaproteobacteria bacterium]
MADWKSGLQVLLIGLGCAAALAGTRHWTAERIAFNETRVARSEIAALVTDPSALPRELPDLGRQGTWRLCDGTLLVRSSVNGYGGPMSLAYTVGGQPATIERLRLISHRETPGITDFLRAPDGWLNLLSGRTAVELKNVAAVSGATITTRALRDHLAAMLAAQSPAAALPLEGCP